MLIVVTLLPAAIFGAFISLMNPAREREAVRNRLSDTAHALSLATDRQVGIAIAGLQGLATSSDLQEGRYSAFAEQAAKFLTANDGWISVVDERGQQHVNTRLGRTDNLPSTDNHEWLGHVFGARDVFVSDAVTGPVVKSPFIAISLRVSRPADAVVLTVSIAPEVLSRLLHEQGLPDGWYGVIADRDGTIIGRTESPELVGKPMTLRLTPPGGLTAATTHEGVPVYIAWTTSTLSGWSTGVAAPQTVLDGPAFRILTLVTAAGVAAFALAALCGWLIGRRVVRPLMNFAASVEDGDRPLAVVSTGLAEIDALTTTFQAKMTALTEAVKAKDHVEAELRMREAAQRDLVRTLDLAAIMIRSMNGNIQFWSRGCENLHGWTAEEVIGRIADEVFHTRYPIPKTEIEALLIRDGRWSGDFIQQRRDGLWLTISVQKALQRDAAGQPVAVLESFSDVTALREARLELTRLNQHLEGRIHEEVAARETAQTRAAHAERMQALGQLAGGIAHDINNVLQAVTGGAALIERNPEDAAGVRRFARMILDAGLRGASVTQRLLAFARKSDLRAEAVDLHALFDGIHEVLSHTLGSAISLKLEKPPLWCKPFVDKAQLETVIVNLVTNSRDALPFGGTITIAAFEDIVTDSSNHVPELPSRAYVAIRVSDTGIGMEKATLAHASEPFFTTKGLGKGTGLGLAMARGFAEQSGGGIHIESAFQKGTSVTLWLPSATDAGPDQNTGLAGRPSREADAVLAGATCLRILLVDDDPIVRESIAEQLLVSGFKVLAMAAASDALAAIEAGEKLDCLVTDLSMPGMNGLTLINLAQQQRPGLQAILLTGYAAETTALAVGGAMTGAFSLLRKPVLGKELADRIASLLSSPSLAND